jgi:hypothetical protein
MRRVDRRIASDAQFVIEDLIPDAASRARWLCLLADAFEVADRVHRGSWAVTLFDDGLRVNVGRIETIVFRLGGAVLVTDAYQYSRDEIDEIRRNPMLGRVSNYATVPDTVNLSLNYGVDANALAAARQRLLVLVERAASRVSLRTNYTGTHSPGVVEYVAVATGRRLRQPDFRRARSGRQPTKP